MISENGESYDRLKKNFTMPSASAQQTFERIRSDTTAELDQVSLRLEEIRGRLIEEAYPK
jgi:hypothetical protein